MGTLVVAFCLPNLCFKQCPCSFLRIPSLFAGTHFLIHKVSGSTLQAKFLHAAGPVAALPIVCSGWEYQDSDLTDWEGGNIFENGFTKMVAISFGSLISIWVAKCRLSGGFSFLGTFFILCAVITLGFARLSMNGTEGNIQFDRVINFLSHAQKMLQTSISVIARPPSSSKGRKGLLATAKKGPKTTPSKEEEEDKTLPETEDCAHKLENVVARFEAGNRQHIKPGRLQDGNQGVGELKEELEASRPLQNANANMSHNIRTGIVSNKDDEVHKPVKEMVLEGIQQKGAAKHVPDDGLQTLHDVSENIVLSFEKNKVPSFLNPHLKPVVSNAGTEEVYGVFGSMDSMNALPVYTIPDVGTMSSIPSIPSHRYVLGIEELKLNADRPQSTHLSLEHMEMSSKSVHRRQHSSSVTTRASKTNGYEPDPWDKFAEGKREAAINGSIDQIAGGKKNIEGPRDLQSQNRLSFYDANSRESTGYEEKEILHSDNVNTARTHRESNASTLIGGGMNKKNDDISSLSSVLSAEDENVMNSQKRDSKTLQLRPTLAKRNSDEANEKENSSMSKFQSDKSINIRQGKTGQSLSNLKGEEFEKLLEEGDSLLNEGEQALNGKLEAGLAELMLYKAAERYADAVSLDPYSLMAIQMWANTLLVHGQLKLKLSQNLRTMLPSDVNSRPDSGSIKEINEQWEIEDVERIALREAFQEASEECEELLIEAGRKYRMALSVDRQDARPLYNWGLALCYRAQLIADEGSERAAQDADKLYMAAIDKFEAMMKIDQAYAAGALFNWGLAMRDRSRLRPIGSKERIRLMTQAKELFEYALRFDPKYGQARGAVAASIAEIEGLQKYSRGKSEEERFYSLYRNKK